MYKVRNTVYSDAGKVLIGKNKKGYQFVGEVADFKEEAITLDNMQINGEFVTYGGIMQYIGTDFTYESLKRDMVKRRYSNDDQIAIILNGDEDAIAKMQAWREWSGQVARKILEVVSTPK